ncbi:hypothetical protein FRC18_003410 [Serendipita sp. 400]|nr:hypothetical protein FRC18_003410 [Serendipita sp. 400]
MASTSTSAPRAFQPIPTKPLPGKIDVRMADKDILYYYNFNGELLNLYDPYTATDGPKDNQVPFYSREGEPFSLNERRQIADNYRKAYANFIELMEAAKAPPKSTSPKDPPPHLPSSTQGTTIPDSQFYDPENPLNITTREDTPHPKGRGISPPSSVKSGDSLYIKLEEEEISIGKGKGSTRFLDTSGRESRNVTFSIFTRLISI